MKATSRVVSSKLFVKIFFVGICLHVFLVKSGVGKSVKKSFFTIHEKNLCENLSFCY